MCLGKLQHGNTMKVETPSLMRMPPNNMSTHAQLVFSPRTTPDAHATLLEHYDQQYVKQEWFQLSSFQPATVSGCFHTPASCNTSVSLIQAMISLFSTAFKSYFLIIAAIHLHLFALDYFHY
jgi:hypothetical protein